MNAQPRFDLVFVLGIARCGSTLLGRLLNGHPLVHCPGELLRLGPALEHGRLCGCGARLEECPYWSGQLGWLQSDYACDERRFDVPLYRRLAQADGADVSVDLSKTLAWRIARRWKDPRVGHILLLRDSRGVLASAVRDGEDPAHQLERHLKWMNRLSGFVDKLGDRGLVVRYEDLCSNPEAELRRIVAFMGLEFDPAMLRPADTVHHFVHSSVSGYLRNQNEIRLDERWRRELDAGTIARIEGVMKKVPVLREQYLLQQPS